MGTLVLLAVRRRDGDHTFGLIEPTLMIDAVEAQCDSPLSGACLAAAHTASLRKGLCRSEDFLRISDCDVGRARDRYRLNDTGLSVVRSWAQFRFERRPLVGKRTRRRDGMNYRFNSGGRYLATAGNGERVRWDPPAFAITPSRNNAR